MRPEGPARAGGETRPKSGKAWTKRWVTTLGDIWRPEVGSRSYAVRVAAVPWNDGRLGWYRTFVSPPRGASWQVVESERVARPMGTQD